MAMRVSQRLITSGDSSKVRALYLSRKMADPLVFVILNLHQNELTMTPLSKTRSPT